ncbi:cytochrome d ubiquinol oxidase subunit II [Streptomyces sp. NPDC002537]
MRLHDFWFLVIAALWSGYLLLESFDLGVGVLTGIVARDERERDALLATIGPVWDGNEVWLITAAGAALAVFPDWYAALVSGFRLPFLALLGCLVVRGAALGYRRGRESRKWGRNCDRAVFCTSVCSAFLWGTVFANIVHGMPIGPDGNVSGSALDLINPYTLLGGVLAVVLLTFHGAVFAARRATGDVRDRVRMMIRPFGIVVVVVALVAFSRIEIHEHGVATAVVMTAAVLTTIGAVELGERGRGHWAFALSGAALAAVCATSFLALFPNVVPSSLGAAWNLTAADAAVGPSTLKVLTWIGIPLALFLVGCQAWAYGALRKRVGLLNSPVIEQQRK